MVSRNRKAVAAKGLFSRPVPGITWPEYALLSLIGSSQEREGLSHICFQSAHPIFMSFFPVFAASHAHVILSASAHGLHANSRGYISFHTLIRGLTALVINIFLACSSLVPIIPPRRHTSDWNECQRRWEVCCLVLCHLDTSYGHRRGANFDWDNGSLRSDVGKLVEYFLN